MLRQLSTVGRRGRYSPMLELFRAEKLKEIAKLAQMAKEGKLQARKALRPGFAHALRQNNISVIAEYKRASPSKGPICETLGVADVALQYKQGGARAMSVLTESRWFRGALEHITQAEKADLPLLRKDFIFDRLQVGATSQTPASAFLLIARFFSTPRMLRDLREYGESLGLESVVEVFDEADLAMARDSGAKIIQVNARDLETLEVDRNRCIQLLENHPRESGEVWICASGISSHEELEQAQQAGFDAALIGTALMKNGTPAADLARILQRPA